MSCSIVVDDVSFSYIEHLPVLQHVSLQFEPGATAVIGQNGAGKTTLMKLLNGLLKPSQGTVMVDGLDTKKYDAGQIAKRVGLVFQNPDDQIFKSRVIDEVMFGPLNIGMNDRQARACAETALRAVELETCVDDNPYDLSYTDRKRICIASVLAMQTDVVVFDEPTISQDAFGLQLMGRIIRDVKDAGKTVIAIVHDMNFAAEHFERIVTMAQGEVIADGTPEEVFSTDAALQLAHVDAPALVKLSRAVELSRPTLTVDAFAAAFQSEKLS